MNFLSASFLAVLLMAALFASATHAGGISAVVQFANDECGADGEWECAEFVARSIANGGYIPGLGAYDSTDSYGDYHGYNLRVVGTLHDGLVSLGWSEQSTNPNGIQGGWAIMGNAGDGPWSHACIGVGPGAIDCHNSAACQVSAADWFAWGVDSILAPPNSISEQQGAQLLKRYKDSVEQKRTPSFYYRPPVIAVAVGITALIAAAAIVAIVLVLRRGNSNTPVVDA